MHRLYRFYLCIRCGMTIQKRTKNFLRCRKKRRNDKTKKKPQMSKRKWRDDEIEQREPVRSVMLMAIRNQKRQHETDFKGTQRKF